MYFKWLTWLIFALPILTGFYYFTVIFIFKPVFIIENQIRRESILITEVFGEINQVCLQINNKWFTCSHAFDHIHPQNFEGVTKCFLANIDSELFHVEIDDVAVSEMGVQVPLKLTF